MVLWLTIAALTAAVIAVLVRPILAQSRRPDEDAAANVAEAPDVAVYRDQLAEIERDRARGLIDATEAEAARREVARRLIAHAPSESTTDLPSAPLPGHAPLSVARGRLAAVALAALVPATAVGLYVAIGAPGMPGLPHAIRAATPADRAPVQDLIGRVEARLRSHPEDGAGWDAIAPVYLRLNRFADAADAFARAGRILGETPDRLLGFAEATVLASNGSVTPPARAAFEKIRAMAPDRPEPRFWLAHAREQDGDLEGAAAGYRALIASAPPDAPWLPGVRERLNDVERKQSGGEATAPAAPAAPDAPPPATAARGPSAADVEAARAMSPAERQQMIEGMVEGLAARLKSDGKDLDGWLKLVRAYKVLDREPDARAALADARKALASDGDAQRALDALATSLGLGS